MGGAHEMGGVKGKEAGRVRERKKESASGTA